MADFSLDDSARLAELLKEKEDRRRFNQFEHWSDNLYPWQKELANCTSDGAQILSMCANQVGKTTTGAWITAMHLTGRYPEWYTGHRFDRPIKAWAAGVSSVTTRDILQANLCGDPEDPDCYGSGMIAKEDLASRTRLPQVPNALQGLVVKHYDKNGKHDGNSVLGFKSFEQGEKKFMGRPMDWIWLDEQPDHNIYTQCITRTVGTNGIVMMTFTPEDGMTPTIHQFLHDRRKGQILKQATWEDAPHLSEERKEQLLAQYSDYEREMRTRGIPMFGDGMVFGYPEEVILVEPFEIPDYWPRISAIDFGWTHPTAVVWAAHDTENDIFYVYGEYRQSKTLPAQDAEVIMARPDGMAPLIWPHDGMKTEKGSGVTLAQRYVELGLNMHPEHFTNPPAMGNIKGDIKIEPGIKAICEAIVTDKFKVFSTCRMWLQEYLMYHRKEGKIVDIDDDLMSATRYAFQMRRFAAQVTSSKFNSYAGMSLPVQSNWLC